MSPNETQMETAQFWGVPQFIENTHSTFQTEEPYLSQETDHPSRPCSASIGGRSGWTEGCYSFQLGNKFLVVLCFFILPLLCFCESLSLWLMIPAFLCLRFLHLFISAPLTKALGSHTACFPRCKLMARTWPPRSADSPAACSKIAWPSSFARSKEAPRTHMRPK